MRRTVVDAVDGGPVAPHGRDRGDGAGAKLGGTPKINVTPK